MGLKDRANRDIQIITGNPLEYNQITFTTPDGLTTATITGIDSEIHLGVDTDGNMVNSKKCHVSISEQFLIDKNYPVRNAGKEVDLVGHFVEVKNSTGVIKKYKAYSIFSDGTVGLITCMLEDFK